MSYRIIDTRSELKDFSNKIKDETVVAVDLEADSMYHFREKVCLIQIAIENENVIIDPLAIDDLSSLRPIFSNRKIRKIFHGADYDIRSLHRDFGISVNNLFDTQIASRFLGFRETGLDAVLTYLFNINLDKRYQKKDWSKRPLPPDMVEYAAKDAIYLIPLARILQEELEKEGRLSWVIEECRILSRVRSDFVEDGSLFLKFKGAGRLPRRNLAVLEELLHLRRELAEKKDRPPFKIFGNDALIKIAENPPQNLKEIEIIDALSTKQIRMYGNDLIQAVHKALSISDKELPVFPRKKTPAPMPQISEKVEIIKQWRNYRAQILALEPGLILTKNQMTALARQSPCTVKELRKVKEIRNWQRLAFGKEIAAIFRSIKDKI